MEDAFNQEEKSKNEIDNLFSRNNSLNYESNKVQKYLKNFFSLYGYDFNQEIIKPEEIQEVSCISFKNKIIQVLLKMLFSEYSKESNSKILIHCSLGMSRSPTLAIMYLMKKLKISFEFVGKILNFNFFFEIYIF